MGINAFWWAGFATYFSAWPMMWIDCIAFSLAAAGFIATRFSKFLSTSTLAHLGILLGFVFVWSFLIVIEGLPGKSSVTFNHWWFIVTAMAGFIVFVDRPRARNAYSILSALSFAICEFGLVTNPAIGPLPAGVAGVMLPLMNTGVHAGVYLTVLLMTGVFIVSIANAEVQIGLANERLEALLSNMLPKQVSDRLRREGKTFADGYSECSVLFADLVGFTGLASRMSPQSLVALLDEIFSRFDELTEELGLEKIKTIGDSYMVAAGLPHPRRDHAQACVKLAMKMRAVIREYADLQLRIGINSGSVVAGVIGKRKFIYDIWGDTVNIASRMESQGVEDEIQVSKSTSDLISAEFVLQSRGEIDIKGKGKMPVFIVQGRRIAPA